MKSKEAVMRQPFSFGKKFHGIVELFENPIDYKRRMCYTIDIRKINVGGLIDERLHKRNN